MSSAPDVMSDIAAPAARVRHRAIALTPFTIALTASLVTVAAVSSALINAPSGTRHVILPVSVAGSVIILGLGLADLAAGRDGAFARGVIVVGLWWSLSALTASPVPLLSSLGHVAQWGLILATIYVVLSWPSGVLPGRTERVLFIATAVLLGGLFAPTALVVQTYPHPSLWSSCVSACPHNAFALTRATPAFVEDVVLPAREALLIVLYASAAVVAVRRAARSAGLLLPLNAPIAALAVIQAGCFAIAFPLRAANPASATLPLLTWTLLLSPPAIALGCGVARLYRRGYTARALDRVERSLSAGVSPERVRRVLADALEDPSVRVLRCFAAQPGVWLDETGAPAGHVPRVGERITDVRGPTMSIAIVHDRALGDNSGLVHIAGSYALAALENDRLRDELGASQVELARSRVGLVNTQVSERQKIERDLHDGAQQRLMALRVKLELAATRLDANNPAQARVVRALGEDVDATIDEVRSFARGIYPPLLARAGLEPALREASRDAPLPTIVNATGLGRFAPETEATVYFSCSEALQNACKHARGATQVTISVWREGRLRFEVRDDGAGFDVNATPYGAGLLNLSDRLTTLGGALTIESTPGRGTALRGSIPLS
jgi:signal transduction histidine kinase